MSGNILTYRLLENANLKQSKEQVIKATISNLRYNLTKEHLKKYSVTCHLPVLTPSLYQERSQWKQEKQINLNVIQIQILKISSAQRVAITKVVTLNHLTMLNRKPTNLSYIRDLQKAKTHLILKAI